MSDFKHEGWDMLAHYLRQATVSLRNIDASLQKTTKVKVGKYEDYLENQGSITSFRIKLEEDNWNDE